MYMCIYTYIYIYNDHNNNNDILYSVLHIITQRAPGLRLRQAAASRGCREGLN